MSAGFKESLDAYRASIKRGLSENEAISRLDADRERERMLLLQKTDGTDVRLVLRDKTDYVLEFVQLMVNHDMPGCTVLSLPTDRPSVKASFFKRLLGSSPSPVVTKVRGYPIGGQKNKSADSYQPKNVLFICEDAKLRVYDIADYTNAPLNSKKALPVHNLEEHTIVVGEMGSIGIDRDRSLGAKNTPPPPSYIPTSIENLLLATAAKHLS